MNAIDMTPADRLDAAIAAGTLIRREWTRTADDGRALACLLATLAPECGAARDANACPAAVMPAWLAYLTPWINDAGTDAAWPRHVARYAELFRASGALFADAQRVRQLDFACRAAALRVAERYAGTDADVVRVVLAFCERVARGDEPTAQEWRDAAARAADAAYAAAYAARAADAAYAAAYAADAAYAAAYAAAYVAARAAAYVAARAAADEIIDGILAAWAEALA